MASAVWDILSRLGPEDALTAERLSTNSSGLATAGPDYAIVATKNLDESALYYKDKAEAHRFAAIAESSRCAAERHCARAPRAARAAAPRAHRRPVLLAAPPPTATARSQENRILRDLQKSRYLCAQPAFAMELCVRGYRAHQVKACTPAYVEHLKCSVKLCVGGGPRMARARNGARERATHTPSPPRQSSSCRHPLPAAVCLLRASAMRSGGGRAGESAMAHPRPPRAAPCPPICRRRASTASAATRRSACRSGRLSTCARRRGRARASR